MVDTVGVVVADIVGDGDDLEKGDDGEDWWKSLLGVGVVGDNAGGGEGSRDFCGEDGFDDEEEVSGGDVSPSVFWAAFLPIRPGGAGFTANS